MSLYYIDRSTGEKRKEVVAGEGFIKLMSNTKAGNSLFELLIKKKLFSSIYGKLQDLKFSKRKINKFIDELAIDMAEAENENISSYSTFNEFFTRKLKPQSRPINFDKYKLISPADGKILAYENIDINKLIQVKGYEYSLRELLQDEDLANEYQYGTYIIVRLSPSDYHRFHFVDNGYIDDSKHIKGYYYSVNPISLKKFIGVYCQNKREISTFKSENFDEILHIEVGATCVGSIVQTYESNSYVKKGDEKGYFKFGGSTVIMLIKKGNVKIDEDILINTKNGYETKVNIGEKIGNKI